MAAPIHIIARVIKIRALANIPDAFT